VPQNSAIFLLNSAKFRAILLVNAAYVYSKIFKCRLSWILLKDICWCEYEVKVEFKCVTMKRYRHAEYIYILASNILHLNLKKIHYFSLVKINIFFSQAFGKHVSILNFNHLFKIYS
jgi:predicted XRE-type DNA-binding protein